MASAARALALPLRAQILVAARPCRSAAVGALTQRPMGGVATLRLHALAAQILVGACESLLAKTTEILLFIAQAVSALLSAMVSLWRINARLLACSR